MHTHIDRNIFHLKVSMPTTSLYILVCSILDEGESPTLIRAKEMWNGTEEDFYEAVNELIKRGILQPAPPWLNGQPEQLYLSGNWRRIV